MSTHRWLCIQCAAPTPTARCAMHPEDVPINLALEEGRFMLAAIEDEERAAHAKAKGRKWALGSLIGLALLCAPIVFVTGMWPLILFWGVALTPSCYMLGHYNGMQDYTPRFTQWVSDINPEPDPEMWGEVLHMKATAGTGLERPGGQHWGDSATSAIIESLID